MVCACASWVDYRPLPARASPRPVAFPKQFGNYPARRRRLRALRSGALCGLSSLAGHGEIVDLVFVMAKEAVWYLGSGFSSVSGELAGFGIPDSANLGGLVPRLLRNAWSGNAEVAFAGTKSTVSPKGGYQTGHSVANCYQTPPSCQSESAQRYQTPSFCPALQTAAAQLHGKVVRKVLKRKDLLTGGGRSFGGWLPVP